jgi:hypothetical protein
MYYFYLFIIFEEFRRDFELMKELERHADESRRELSAAETAFVSTLRKRRKLTPASEEAREALSTSRHRAVLKQSEKVVLAESMLGTLDKVLQRMDGDLAQFEKHLAATGCFDSLGAEQGSEVAIRPDAFGDGSEWILGRVLRFYRDTGYYDILDMDDESRKYFLSESQVVVLLGEDAPVGTSDGSTAGRKFARGEEVFAVYPDTTSFYPAIVAQTKKGIVGVQFDGDDPDDFGQLPIRLVPAKYVIRQLAS